MGVPTQPVLDIMRRSLANLEFVEKHAGPDGPHAVTQLLNTFLGALAHPWEAMRADLLRLPLNEAAERGWPTLEKELPTDDTPESLGDLVRLLRNGTAHGNVDFLPDGRGQIRALRIWNARSNGARTWGAVVTVRDARAFLHGFAQLIEEHHRTHGYFDRRTA